MVDRNHQGVVNLEQVVVGGFRIAAVGHFTLSVVQSGDKANALAFTLDVVVTPFPLIARSLDGQVGIGSVFAGHHRFGGRQRHQDHDDERDYGPSDFDFDRLVESGGLVTQGFAVFPNGIEHHTKHGHKNHRADDQHEPVQPNLLLGNFGDRRVQIQLVDGWSAGQIVDSPSCCRTIGSQCQRCRFQFFVNVVHHVCIESTEKVLPLNQQILATEH